MSAIDTKALKAKHGRIAVVTVTVPNIEPDMDPNTQSPVLDEDGNEVFGSREIQFAYRHPDRKVMRASAKVAKEDPVKAVEVIMDTLYLAGPKEELDDFATWSAVSEEVSKLLEPHKATLKNY